MVMTAAESAITITVFFFTNCSIADRMHTLFILFALLLFLSVQHFLFAIDEVVLAKPQLYAKLLSFAELSKLLRYLSKHLLPDDTLQMLLCWLPQECDEFLSQFLLL